MDPKDCKKIIESLTTSGITRKDDISSHDDLKKIKSLCKNGGNSVVEDVFRLLMTQLHKKSSQIRLSTLLIMNELFVRSHCFRGLLVGQSSTLDIFTSLVGLSPTTESSEPLPPPPEARKLLIKRAAEIFDEWSTSFGKSYPLLPSAVDYLSKYGVTFPSRRHVVPQHVLEAQRKEEERKKKLLEEKIAQVVTDFQQLQQDISATLFEVNQAVRLLVPEFGIYNECDGGVDADDGQVESEGRTGESPTVRANKEGDEHVTPGSRTSNTSDVTENSSKKNEMDKKDNESPSVSDQLKRVENEVQSSSTDDPKNVNRKEHGIVGKDFQLTILVKPVETKVTVNEDNRDVVNALRDSYKILVRDCLPKLKEMMSKLSKGVEFSETALKEAIDLKNVILSVVSKLSLMGLLVEENNDEDSSDGDDDFIEVPEKPDVQLHIPQHERHLYGLEPETNNPPILPISEGRMCRAPLSTGRLCPRMDAVKCPFHGKIVDRDALGVPVKEEDRLREEKEKEGQVPEWQDPVFLRDLQAATGVDLTLSRNRKRKGALSLSDARKVKTTRDRLMEKIFAKETQLRVTEDEEKRLSANHRQYGDNWNYAMNS